jgi:pimeloyl-ACP methyl ester carboxylesterase
MANIELSHFNALHPERVLKLVFLDAAYDRASASYKEMMKNSPWKRIQPPGLDVNYYSPEEYFAAMKRAYPSFKVIWTEAMQEQSLHEITRTPDGKIVDRMSDDINTALMETLTHYEPEDSQIRVPVLAFYSLSKGLHAISADWMTEEQKIDLRNHVVTREEAWTRDSIEQFRRNVPQAVIIEISNGHHYCFISDEEFVYEEMRSFLLE